jgi:hypothetical protein
MTMKGGKMKLKRVIDLDYNEAKKIYARQHAGTMKTYYDDNLYACFDEDELETYKPRKSGRPPKKRSV